MHEKMVQVGKGREGVALGERRGWFGVEGVGLAEKGLLW